MITAKPRAARRGVLLLVVLSMLALFSMLAIAYLVIATHNERAAKSFQKLDRQTFSPGDDVQQAALMAIRGSQSPDCPIMPHSLLEDIYGNSSIQGHVLPPNGYSLQPDDPNNPLPFTGSGPLFLYRPTAPLFPFQTAGQQLLEFSVIVYPQMLARLYLNDGVLTPNEIKQWQEAEENEARRRVGCVLTMLDGPAAGRSTRIVGFRQKVRPLPSPPHPANSQIMENRIQIVAFEGVSPPDVGNFAGLAGGRFVINGTPFSGTGFGFDPNGASDKAWLNGRDPGGIPFALRPNAAAPTFVPGTPPRTQRFYGINHLFGLNGQRYSGSAGEPGLDDDLAANEDYDAVDYQNMLLAMVIPVDPSTPSRSGGSVPIPSLHRPALINYWYHRMADPTSGLIPWPAGKTLKQRWLAIHQPYGRDLIRGSSDDLVPTQASDQIVQLKRKILLRPLPEDHPEFNGENPASQVPDLSGWDVDRLSTRYWERCGSWDPRAALGAPPPWDPNLPWNDPANRDYVTFRNNLEAWELANGTVDGNWDVDNDGDGIKDGIWVDVAMPIRTAKDGRKYKPLVSYLVVDLDGRLNLNAHGCLAQLNPGYNVDRMPSNDFFAGSTPGNPINARLPRGQGYGPAEINLEPLFRVNPLLPEPLQPDFAPLYLYKKLLLGVHDVSFNPPQELDGRYGEAYFSGLAHLVGAVPPNFLLRPAPGRTGNDDLTSANKHYDYPEDFFNGSLPSRSYGTPPDLKGSLAVGLNVAGQPIYKILPDPPVFPGDPVRRRSDNPYEMDLSRTTPRGHQTPSPRDNPYTLPELERVLRPFDVDQATLPDRLTTLTSLDPANYPSVLYDRRHEITTDSWDLPCPNVVETLEMRKKEGGTHARPRHLTDLVEAQLRSNGLSDAQIFAVLPTLLPTEMLAGLRMDLNRPFGNGVDDDGNGVVDEPSERLTLAANGRLEMLWFKRVPLGPASPAMPGVGQLVSVPFDHDNDGFGGTDEHNETSKPPGFDPYGKYRQEYAKHLYVLMMLLSDPAAYPRWIDSGSASFDPTRERARWIAQWAVNVVDFRDRDAIMTRFDFDPTPFDANGWNPSGTDFVWGCERPELLITETLAFHDRRTEDTKSATLREESNETWDPTNPPTSDTYADSAKNSAGDLPDLSFDQRLRPEGSLFIELHNPWLNTGVSEPKPGEFYFDRSSGSWTNGVDLAARSGAGGPSDDPVWRMAIVFEPDEDPDGVFVQPGLDDRERDPTDPDPSVNPDGTLKKRLPAASIERAIYFTQPSSPYGLPQAFSHYPDPALPAIPMIKPGDYAVIGSGRPGDSGQIDTHLGLRTGQTSEQTNDRMIVLDLNPAANPKVEIRQDADNTVPAWLNRNRVIPIAINRPTRLSVSEPAIEASAGSAYTDVGYDSTRGEYNPLLDEPLDKQNNPNRYLNYLIKDGTHANFCVIHLQRLADPLRPWNLDFNPYLTVDSMPIDLTVFNGVDNGSTEPDRIPPAGFAKPAPPYKFYSRERGEYEYERWTTTNSNFGYPSNPWKHEPTLNKNQWKPATGRVRRDRAWFPNSSPVTGFVFDQPLDQSLSYFNKQFGSQQQGPLPPRAFAWMTWNNRPFVSNLELLMVPGVSPYQLLGMVEVGAERNVPNPNSPNPPPARPYVPFPFSDGIDPAGSTVTAPMFPHLMNFFYSVKPPSGGAGTPSPAAQMHRMLDFVHVPSRFAGTETLTDPVASAGPGLGRHRLHPPFNRISRYRDPGRINLNTIFSRRVWLGLMNDFPGFSLAGTQQPGNPPYWARFFDERFMVSRRGYDHPLQFDPNPSNFFQNYLLGDGLTMNPDSPTRFANPFRSSSGEYLVPLEKSLGGRQSFPPGAQNPNFEIDPGEIGATLLRPDPLVRKVDTTPTPAKVALIRPLFSFDAGVTNLNPQEPLERLLPVPISAGQNAPWADQYYARNRDKFNDHDRDPAFRYQALERLGNLVTTRSNVYAIWVTVGYFEVAPPRERQSGGPPVDRNVYLEGYTLGRELGTDSGEVERHRAFYVFDRSIPVAFERGRDLNVDQAILLKRFIE